MKKIYLLLLTVSFIGLTSCEDYLDINTDPNKPSQANVDVNMIFPGAEMNLAASYGDFLRIVGGYYSQHYSHSFGTSNYLDYSQFKMSAVRSSGTYSQLFSRTLKNLETIREKSSAAEEWGTYLAATTLRVFTYQTLVDVYGEIPYSEGLDIENLSPAYDDGATVYQGILTELDEALSKASPSSVVSTNFLFQSSSANEWIKFANALKLKLLMRISKVQNVEDQLSTLIEEGNFPESDVAWDNIWEDASGKANPFYQEEFSIDFGSTQVNVIANIALMNTMLASGDGRVESFFETNEDEEYKGGVSGTNFSTSDVYNSAYFSRPIIKYDSPVFLITLSEIEFFLSEYEARYGSMTAAEEHYQAAIEASFATAGVSGAADIYTVQYPWVDADYEKLIGIQKWVALSGTNNFEAWCELRRLKYPEFGTATGDDIYDVSNDVFSPEEYVPGTLYTPIKYNTELGAGKVLQRFKYAESSSNRNSNAPANKGDATPVFWAN